MFSRTWQHSSCLCSSFALDNSSDATVTGTTYFPANALVNITNEYSSIDTDTLPAFCRVELTITTNTTANSSCKTEVWLPDDWNGRFLAVGNGGFGGGATVAELGYIAVNQSFARVSTDTSHTSAANVGDWAGPRNDNAIVDWAWRALHLSVVAGKEVVQQYYNQTAQKAYYLGCSTGKPSSLKEVQMFPDDFDGVVVGSPANWQTHVNSWGMHLAQEVQPSDSAHFISRHTWVDQCDSLDGLADGIISDPRSCHFRPETLTCGPGQNTSTCLTVPQLEAFHRIYSDYYETNQTWIFGRYYPGGEEKYPDGNVDTVPKGADWFRYFVLKYELNRFSIRMVIQQYNASVIEIADSIDPGQTNAIDANITAFAGRLTMANCCNIPGGSFHYHDTVDVFTRAHTEMDTDDFYRLFTVPGMNHCYGGFGANAFGGVEQASNGMPPVSFDPEHNILAAIVQWVEQGEAPSSLIAAYYTDNNATNGVGFTRPLCQYPKALQYNGGDNTTASSFSCV
ncbi:feruloyl esterase-like protein [Amylocystis lapponica]|nr:feruloyl esterase-like protein [Amylocystis lapponica]